MRAVSARWGGLGCRTFWAALVTVLLVTAPSVTLADAAPGDTGASCLTITRELASVKAELAAVRVSAASATSALEGARAATAKAASDKAEMTKLLSAAEQSLMACSASLLQSQKDAIEVRSPVPTPLSQL